MVPQIKYDIFLIVSNDPPTYFPVNPVQEYKYIIKQVVQKKRID